MIEGGGSLGFQFETLQTLRIPRLVVGKDLDRDVTLQRSIACAIDLAHSARAEWAEDFEGAQPGSRDQWHRWTGSYRRSETREVTPKCCMATASSQPAVVKGDCPLCRSLQP